MTPTEIETSARNRYNSIGDSFFSQAEILDMMWDACLDMTRETNIIERLYSTSTVASQQDYTYPTNAIALKRVTYEGRKLMPISLREDDQITGLNQATTATGTPRYYFIWNSVISLRPVPTGVGTLKIYTYNEPSVITNTSVLEIPVQFHMDLIDYIVSEMAAKDSNFQAAQYYQQKWEQAKLNVKKWQKRRLRSDGFSSVQMDDQVFNYNGLI